MEREWSLEMIYSTFDSSANMWGKKKEKKTRKWKSNSKIHGNMEWLIYKVAKWG